MWHTLKIIEVIDKLKTNKKYGLYEDEVKKRQKEYGKNILEDKKKKSIFIRFLEQFNDFMIIILIVAGIVSAFVSKMQGDNDFIDSIIIIGIVVFNALMGLIQETKAEKAIEALKKLTPNYANVIRDGKNVQILADELVPGDIVILEAGKVVPADCRLIETNNLKIEEASLTGETEAVLKNAEEVFDKDASIGDMQNLAFMATTVVNGHGKGIVTDIGMNTKVGKIADMINQDEAPETPIQKKLGEVGKILGIVCLVICLLIFLIGVAKHIPAVEMFMTSVGLAVAAIPEGLPAVVTIILSIGVTKMAKKNSIMRKLPAVETLGSSSVICSDKTGTLTQNKMEVVKIESDNKDLTLELGVMCTDCELVYEFGKEQIKGDPTEIAIIEAGNRKGIRKSIMYFTYKRVNDIPFDSNRKMMSTIHQYGNKYRVITKGAPDVLIERCNYIYKDGNVISLTKREKEGLQNKNYLMAKDALRVIAVAYQDIDRIPNKIDSNNIENNLIFVGLIGMKDPVKFGVKEAVKKCRRAGIKTVMITGDHIATAEAIAKELGILTMGGKAISGKELDSISQKELERNIKNYSVFARVTPEHKVRIVNAWQKNGAVVAMTGDGVNDSPALKNADIGISMGKEGTDVAKNASDMILTDDNFVTIVEAVKQGRVIYDNIRKAMHFLIATNIGEIVTIFVGLILGYKSPLLAIQLLWINLVTDSFPGIAIGLEPEEDDIMLRKPRDSKKGIFSDGLWGKIVTEGIMIGILTLVAFSIGTKYYGIEVGRTMAFISMGVLELVHSFNIKSDKSILNKKIFNNKYMILSLLGGIFAQTIVVIVPALANIFNVTNLSIMQWIITGLISISPIPIMEIQKKINNWSFGGMWMEEVKE